MKPCLFTLLRARHKKDNWICWMAYERHFSINQNFDSKIYKVCWSHRTHRTSFDMTPTDLEQSSIFKINFTLFSHYCREQNIQRCVFKYVTFNSTSSVLYSLESFWSSTLCFFIHIINQFCIVSVILKN